MDTLYDLLGALPRDDAEELRVAFRRAVKGSHPDLHPGDPDAGFKFRQIVRANEILADPDQRATYDHLLDLAEDEKKQLGKESFMHKVVAATSFVLSLGFIAGASVGGYLLYQQIPDELSEPIGRVASAVNNVAASLREPFEAAPAPSIAPAAPITVATIAIPVTPRAEIVAAPLKPVTTNVPGDDVGTASVTLASDTEVAPAPAPAGPPLEIAPADAKAFRERGIFAYRSGDLDSAIADFDRAIKLDPKFAAAYIDRGIVLYRMQKFERAFADIAQAKKIENKKGAKAERKQRSVDPAIEMSVTPQSPRQRHAARLAPPREVGFLVNRRPMPPQY